MAASVTNILSCCQIAGLGLGFRRCNRCLKLTFVPLRIFAISLFKILLQELKFFIDFLPPSHLAACRLKVIIYESKIIANEPMVIYKASKLL